MARPRRALGLSLLAASALLAAMVLLIAEAGGGAATATTRHRSEGATAGSMTTTTAAASGRLRATVTAMVTKAEASAKALTSSPGMPACKPPPLPAATYPPGHSYGVPFLAAITNGQILAGYDEWTANHPTWTANGKTYHLYPWQAKVYDVTGWVTGLLQLPSLSATIPASGIVFCDQGGKACVSANPPAGECIHVNLNAAPDPGQPPPPTITNDPPPGHQCYEAKNHCIPYIINIAAAGTSSLTVTSVQPNGELDLQVATSAVTTLSTDIPNVYETCSDAMTTISLSTTLPARLPAGAPTAPAAGLPDLRNLQVPPAPLSGPLASASSTVGGDDFSVPGFSTTKCPLLAAVFDAPLAGWNNKSPSQPASVNNNYYDKTPYPADAGTPGWVQFSAVTTVSDLGLPVGPPSSFSLGVAAGG